MADDAQSILTPVQADNSVKADAWQAFKDSANEREFGAKLQGINLPREVKADLWEAKRRAGASPTQELGLPNAADQAKAQLMANNPITASQPDLGDQLRNAQAAGQVPQANPQLQKLAPFVGAGIGANAIAKGGPFIAQTLMKMAGAGLGGAAGDAGQQLSETGKVNPGQSATTGGVMAAGEGIGETVISPLLKWLGASKTVGAQLLQQASAKAGNAPVEMSAKTNEIVEEITKQGKLGGTVPKVITDLLERVGPSTKQAADAVPGPLTYDEARILQSNASSMSAQEQMTLKGKLKYLIPQFAKSFGQDVQAAADQAGIGTEHAAGMREFAQASARNRTLKRLGAAAATSAGIYGTYRELQSLKK